MNSDKKGKQYVPFGACFMGVGKNGSFKLSDIQLVGASSGSDLVHVLEAGKASVSASYRYISHDEAIELEDESLEGWWNETSTTPMGDTTFPVGSAFLGSFGSGNVVVNFAGQVPDAGVAMDCIGKKWVMFANIAPRTVKLGEFMLLGGSSGSDLIQVLEPERASVSVSYRYISKEEAIELEDESLEGWWNSKQNVPMDDVEIPAGSAFLGCFGTGNVTIAFPSPVK